MEQDDLKVIKIIGVIVAIFVLLIVVSFLFPVVVIGAGERGVVFNNGSGVEDRILGEGVHFRMPFVESVHSMSIRTQTTTFDEKGSNSAGSKDSQQVDVQVTVNWHLDGSTVNKIYQSVGDLSDVRDNVLTNNVQDSVKAAMSRYQALEIQRNRDHVADAAETLLQEKVKRYHVIIENLSLTNINFSSDFNAAVENAQKANQQANAAENRVRQVQAEAQSAIAKAKGEAQAQAEVQQSLTPELLQKMWIEKWNGVLPSTDLGNNTPSFILNK